MVAESITLNNSQNPSNYNLGGDYSSFLEKIKDIQSRIVGYEEYGSTTEFYDEDGVVLMQTDTMENGEVYFYFSDENSMFCYKTMK